MRAHRIVILTFAVLSGCGTITMRVSRNELQTDMAKRFPVESDKQVVVLTASDPQVEFLHTDVLAVRLRIDAISASGKSHLTGTTRVEGRIEYVEADHAFYLRDPKVTELALAPPEGDGSLSRVADGAHNALGTKLIERAARSGIEELLKRHPVYRLDAKRSEQEAKAIGHLRSVRIDGQDLVLEVGL